MAEQAGMNKALIGKEYPEVEYEVNPKDCTFYALASNDPDNPWYWQESRPGGIVAPPMFAVVYGGVVIPQVILDQELKMNVALMVHGEQDIKFHKLVKPGMKIKSKAKIVDILDKGTGELCQIMVTSHDQAGELVSESLYGFFVRAGGSGKKPEKKPEPEPGETIFEMKMKVLPLQPYIYAWASGDHNPIHTNPDFATKIARLPNIILQGLCTMAFCQKALVDKLLEQNPERLKRLAVRFSRPVLPEDELTIYGWEIEAGTPRKIGFEAKKQDGTVVIKNGLAEIE